MRSVPPAVAGGFGAVARPSGRALWSAATRRRFQKARLVAQVVNLRFVYPRGFAAAHSGKPVAYRVDWLMILRLRLKTSSRFDC
jgi:hypothetical protein